MRCDSCYFIVLKSVCSDSQTPTGNSTYRHKLSVSTWLLQHVNAIMYSYSLFQMHSPWHIETAYWAAVMFHDKLPILHAYPFSMARSTLFQMDCLVAFAVFPIRIFSNTQTGWITGKSTDVKITTYVFSTKDPQAKKIHYYQHKPAVVYDPPSSQQKKDVLIVASHTQDMFRNTAKNITWCSMLIWCWFRKQDLIE